MALRPASQALCTHITDHWALVATSIGLRAFSHPGRSGAAASGLYHIRRREYLGDGKQEGEERKGEGDGIGREGSAYA